MKILSLFNGISGARVALDRAGIKVNKFYSSEIDKYANAITDYQYPDTIQLGDITNWREWDIEQPDLIVFGSPCQGFSLAGKQLNFDDPRSALFFTAKDILDHYKPKYFLMENVKMKKEYSDKITEILGVEPILINSALISAQNRNRLYWTNIPGIEQPEDKGILLKDIIEIDTVESPAPRNKRNDREYNKSGDKANCLLASCYKGAGNNGMPLVEYVDRDKSYCIDANYFKGGNPEQYFNKKRRQLVFERPCEPREFNEDSICHHAGTATDIKGNESIKRVYADSGKAPTLTTMGGGHREPKILSEKLKYRKLSCLECARLQTYPDDWCDKGIMNGKEVDISNTQRYKALGNSFTVDVIAHIFKEIEG